MPGISLPIGHSEEEGLAVGIEIDGLASSDARLLSIASLVEHILARGPTKS